MYNVCISERWIPVDMEMSNNKQEDHCTTVVCSLKYLQAQRKFVRILPLLYQPEKKILSSAYQIASRFCFQTASRLIPYFASRLLLLVNNMAAEFFSYWQYVFWQKKLSMLIWCLTFDLHWLARYSSESSWCQSVGWSVWGGCSDGCHWTSCIWWWCTKLISTICVAGEEGHWTSCMWWRTEFRVWYGRYVSYHKRNLHTTNLWQARWTMKESSLVTGVCIPWNCSKFCSTKGNATSSHCAFTQFIGSLSATVVQLYALPSPFSL